MEWVIDLSGAAAAEPAEAQQPDRVATLGEAALTLRLISRAREAAADAQREAAAEKLDDRARLELGKALAALQNAEMFLTGDPG